MFVLKYNLYYIGKNKQLRLWSLPASIRNKKNINNIADMLKYYIPLVLLVVYILFVLYKISVRKPTVDIVIARYEENLSWIKELPIPEYSNVIIYNKGSPITSVALPNVHIESLPNLGRESHTYYHHAIKNYNNLADMTLFLPASVWSVEKKRLKLLQILDSIKSDFRSTITGIKDQVLIENEKMFEINSYTTSNEENRKKNSDSYLEKSQLRPLNTWFTNHFPKEELTCMSYNGIMAVTRSSIHKRPKEFYEKLLVEHAFKNPEVGHYSERTWKNIFSIDNCVEDLEKTRIFKFLS